MSGPWLNASRSYSNGLQLGEATSDEEYGSTVGWEIFEKKIPSVPALSLFRALQPQFKGVIASKAMEAKVLLHGHEWMCLMVRGEADREVFEAATLVICAMTLVEEETAQSIAELGVLEQMEVYGYSVQALLAILGRVLVPSLVVRLKQLMVACIHTQERHKFPSPQGRASMYRNMKTSYDKYLRFRNLDGFFEGGLIVSLAAAGVSGDGLPSGVMGDVVESTILSHDAHGIVRHFAEEDIANMHRYAPGSIYETLLRSFLRNALLARHVRACDLPREVKRALLNYSSSYQIFPYACQRYGYGSTYCEAVSFTQGQANHGESLGG